MNMLPFDISDIPRNICTGAADVSRYFKERNINGWEFDDIADRGLVERLRAELEAANMAHGLAKVSYESEHRLRLSCETALEERDAELTEARRLIDEARGQVPFGWVMDNGRWSKEQPSGLDSLVLSTMPVFAAAPVPAQTATKTLYSLGADRVIRKHTTDNTAGVYVAELAGWDAGLLGDLLNSAPGAHPPDTYFKQPAVPDDARKLLTTDDTKEGRSNG